MPESPLQQLRRRLSPTTIPARRTFSSVTLESRAGAGLAPGEAIVLRLGVPGDPPLSIHGHIFDAQSGILVATVEAGFLDDSVSDARWQFSVPGTLPQGRHCLVGEGLWADSSIAGFEIGFDTIR